MTVRHRDRPASGPRIYNLFPLLAGTTTDWVSHLPRIAAMRFDWVYVNPFHYPGFSGSLYAVKEPARLNDLFDAGGDAEMQVRDFASACAGHDLRLAIDLVVNHTAKDAVLAEDHPDWYRRDCDGALYSPRVADPDDPDKVTVWGDLAELDYEHPAARRGLVDYWARYVERQIELGVGGFRCDAAYKVPAEVWRELIAAGRSAAPDTLFFAETLGCGIEDVAALADAGFDYLFNSAKWWNFRDDWLLDQYERMRAIAPSIAFPESHDTVRAATEAGSDDPDRVSRHLKLRYLFASCFSSGVMMPIGYEYGFRRPLHVVETRPRDWEDTGIDLSGYIADVNAVKASLPVLNRETRQRRISGPDGGGVALLRQDDDDLSDCVITVLNPDPGRPTEVDAGRLLAAAGGGIDGLQDITPQATPVAPTPGVPLRLEPLDGRVFRGVRKPDRRSRPKTPARAAEKRLRELAAHRVTIEEVWPEIDAGRHPVKRVVGDVMEVWADIFSDGHDSVAACVRFRAEDERSWHEAPMDLVDNDRWCGRVPLVRNTRYRYTIEAWRDLFASWHHDVGVKRAAGQDIALELTEGRHLIERACDAADDVGRTMLERLLRRIEDVAADAEKAAGLLLSEDTAQAMSRHGIRTDLTRYRHELEVWVDRTAGRYGAWYELFPRSMSDDPTRHGTFDDVIAKLPYVRDLGFDVLYFPPIHPIGRSFRKGRNNSLTPAPDDPGSPYAIGSSEGGHTAIHPQLGTLEDFRRLVTEARRHGLEIALDFAIQCSQDHPWIKQHPEWFDWRPDGTIKYAENPPKKYQDIVNVHFYREALPAIWHALRDVVLFWVDQGVSIFRVDNPHTKPVPFWEWLIREVQDRHPQVLFLSEAFTRPKMMKKLAKVGFTQSYTYFTWRHTKAELTEYLTELTQWAPKEFMRPNFFVNTPDINPIPLQTGGRALFQVRAVLAGTLSSLWGMYSGFELCEATPIPGREEYLDSEKYEIKAWEWDRPGNIRGTVARLNRIRRDNPALQELTNLRFHPAANDQVLFYAKMTAARDNVLWIAVNLDPHHAQEATLELPLYTLGLPDDAAVDAIELLSGETVRWHGTLQSVRLDPSLNPCAIWRVTPSQL